MSTTDTPPPADTGPRVSSDEARDLGRLRRTTKASPQGRHIAGVAGGLARHFDVDPVLVRVALVVLVFFGGAGLLLYGAGWLLIPEEGSEHATVQLDERNRSLALYVAAALAALALLGDTIGRFDFPWPLAVVALILLVVLGNRDRVKAPDWRPFQGSAPGTDGPVATADDAPAGTATTGAATGWTTGTAAYAAPTDAPWTAPAGTPPAAGPAYVPAPNPRRRGPILFWFTLALIALLEGVLGILDAGLSIPDPAYAALAVGVTGTMLVLGAFWGRAGGLVLVGLLATAWLGLSVAAQEYDGDGDHIHAVPTTAAGLEPDYSIGAGELKVDLTAVTDPTALDGRVLDLSGGVGTIQVTVPEDLNVVLRSDVHGPGHIEFFADDRGGWDTSMNRSHVVAADAPTLTIEADLGVGEIAVRSE